MTDPTTELESPLAYPSRQRRLEIAEASSLRESYADWLKQYHWDYFFTSTFRKPRKDPYYAIQAVWRSLQWNNVRRAFLCCEPHQTGDAHIHGIIAGAGPGWYPEIDLPWVIWNDLFKSFGRAKVTACNNQAAVAGYCAKYILKKQEGKDHYEVFGTKLNWHDGLLEKLDKPVEYVLS